MIRLAVEALLGLAVVLLSGGIGYAWRGAQDAEAVAQANAAVTSASGSFAAAADSQLKAIALLETRLAEIRARHEQFRELADDELDARIEANATLAAEVARLTNQIKGTAHDPSCAPLAALPVCTAVADRLWPQADTSRAGARADGGVPGD